MAAHTLASMMSGLAASLLSCPADVIKTRMMSQTSSDVGMGKGGWGDGRVSNASAKEGMGKGAKSIGRDTPIVNDNKECANGNNSTSMRTRDVIVGSGPKVIRTRMIQKELHGNQTIMYRNSVHCLVHVVKTEGVRALWKGFLPTWARLGPWQFVFWVSYEELRRFAGLGSF